MCVLKDINVLHLYGQFLNNKQYTGTGTILHWASSERKLFNSVPAVCLLHVCAHFCIYLYVCMDINKQVCVYISHSSVKIKWQTGSVFLHENRLSYPHLTHFISVTGKEHKQLQASWLVITSYPTAICSTLRYIQVDGHSQKKNTEETQFVC